MPVYNITTRDIENAKTITKKFDEQKTYNKLECINNYLGVLGEAKFKDFLSNLQVIYTWNTFIKADYSQTDFLINGHSIDIKTTYDDCLWIQKPEWDYYVLIIVDKDNRNLSICGWIDKESLIKLCKRKYLVEREGRKDYRIPVDLLNPMTTFESQFRKI